MAISAACLKSPSEPAVQEPASITLSSYSIVLTAIGQRFLINATVLDQDSRVISDATIFFRSSNEKIATVGNSGLVTAVSMGSTQITVSSGYATASATVTVMQEAGSITITPPSATLTTVGETVQLTAEVKDTGKTTIPGAAVVWSSSDPQFATVDANGLVTAVSSGTTQITATSAGVSQSSTVYVVIPKPAERIDLNISQATLTSVGQSLKLDALVYDIDGVAIPDAPVAWSSSHPVVAAVDTTGLVSAVANGTTLVTATSGGITTFATIHVVIEGTVPPPPPPPPPPPEPSNDREALIAFYNATDGPNWAIGTNWLSDEPIGEWFGVDANTSEKVINLRLGDNNLVGTIPAELRQLSSLHSLKLGLNKLSGPIPPELGELSNLDFLELHANELSGSIPPELGQLKNLSDLLLHSNQLTGSIPAELGELTELRHLNVNFNNLTGSIPKELGQLAHLRYLRLDGNELTGTIPPELGELTKLETMDLENNALTGSIPSELGQLTDLGWLLINRNELTGSIPPELGALAELTILSAGDNQLTGSIPPELGNLSKLKILEFLKNGLVGDVPPELGRLTNLERLYLGENKLQGEVPSELGDLTNLKTLDLQQNTGLTGPLPLSLTGVSLTELRLNSTKLCVPSGAVFQAWLVGIGTKTGIRNCEEESEPSPDLDALIAFYHATGGQEWTNSTNWLTDAPLGEWFGVTTDDDGRVTKLSLDSQQPDRRHTA